VKREKRLTKREQKALKAAAAPSAHAHTHDQPHIHCVACGRHLDPSEFDGASPLATHVRCAHGKEWSTCVGCAVRARELLAIHDRTGQPVQHASAWH
jgi:hypothetical protein